MPIKNDDVISTLNDLIANCNDGVKGFRAAADAVGSASMKELLSARAQNVQQARAELQSEVRRLGGDPDTSGTAAGALHRGWIDLKAAVTGKNDNTIIAECVRGEEAAEKRYEDALGKDLPSNVRSIVERQYQGVLNNLDSMRALEHGNSAGAMSRAHEADRNASPGM